MSFESDMNKIRRKYEKGLHNATVATLLAITNEVIHGTPVDTGRARGNWQATIGNPAEGAVSSLDIDGGKTYRAAVPIAKESAGNIYCLTNNVPYIGRLEFEPGFNKKTETGWVRKSVKNFKKYLKHNMKAEGF